MTSYRWNFSWVLVLVFSVSAWGQAVISARSGLIHFIEGSVFLDDKRIETAFGKFEQMKDGSELQTQNGRAEVLLTPGTFIRLDEITAIRMVSSQLQNTRVELLEGSVVVESQNGSAKGPISILYKDYQVQVREAGRFRMDAAPAQLKVETGHVEVFHAGDSVAMDAGSVLPFSGSLAATKQAGDSAADALDEWNTARSNSIFDADSEAGRANDLSSAVQSWQDDPDAVLRSMVTSGRIPLSSYPLPNYAPLPSYGGLYPYNSFASPGLLGPPPAFLGLGTLIPLYAYPRVATPYYPYSPLGAGSSTIPLHRSFGAGAGSYAHPPTAVHPAAPIHSGIGRVGGHR